MTLFSADKPTISVTDIHNTEEQNKLHHISCTQGSIDLWSSILRKTNLSPEERRNIENLRTLDLYHQDLSTK